MHSIRMMLHRFLEAKPPTSLFLFDDDPEYKLYRELGESGLPITFVGREDTPKGVIIKILIPAAQAQMVEDRIESERKKIPNWSKLKMGVLHRHGSL